MTERAHADTPSSAFRREMFAPPSARAIQREVTFDDITDPLDGFHDAAPPRDIRTNPANPIRTAAPDEVPTEADLPFESLEPALERTRTPTGASALPEHAQTDPDEVSTEPLPKGLLATGALCVGGAAVTGALMLVLGGLAVWAAAGPAPETVSVLGF